MKFDIPYSRLDPVYWDGQERRAQSGIYGYEWMGVPKFPYLSSNNGKFSKISFLFLYYSIKFGKSQMFDIFSATGMGQQKRLHLNFFVMSCLKNHPKNKQMIYYIICYELGVFLELGQMLPIKNTPKNKQMKKYQMVVFRGKFLYNVDKYYDYYSKLLVAPTARK